MKQLLFTFSLLVLLFTACQKEMDPYTFVPTSVGTLGITGADSCTGASVSGTYKKGTALVANANTVSIAVNVTTIGTYAIYTDTVKGIYFGRIDSFSTTGSQTVVLKGAGLPTDTGLIKLTVKYGGSTCKFFVRVDTGSNVVVIPPANSDYFPMTTGSNWNYDEYNYDSNGTITRQSTNSNISTGALKNANGYKYNIFIYSDSSGSHDTSYFRKEAGAYYSLARHDDTHEEIILKDNLPTGTTWSYQSLIPNTQGNPDTSKTIYTILAKGVPVTLNGTTFPDVIKILQTNGLGYSGEYHEIWFARGVGYIYESDKNSKNNMFDEIIINKYKVY